MIRKWLRTLIVESLLEYYNNRPVDKIITNRSPSDLDYHFFPGTRWENSFTGKKYKLDRLVAEWVEEEQT